MYAIRSIPVDERPRERLLRHGPEALSNAELIALLLGSGMKGKPVLVLAQDLLSRFGSLPAVADATVAELCDVKGLGQAKAIQLKAAFSLAGKLARQEGARVQIQSPVHAYQFVRDGLEEAKEERFVVLLLDAKGFVLRQDTVSIGTLSRTLVHPREVFYPAIRHKAASLIAVHNHPSGDPSPSAEDLTLTKRLIEAGAVVGIPLHDHLVIGKGSFVSLRERSLGGF